jgi:hypothetical protein
VFLREHNNKDIHIHVDSQAALQSPKLQITSKTVRQTVELFWELAVRHTVTLQWAKAHLGIPGNKMADEAAKAVSQSKRFTQMEISNSRTELKTFIRDAQNLQWARLWADREGIDCRQTNMIVLSNTKPKGVEGSIFQLYASMPGKNNTLPN